MHECVALHSPRWSDISTFRKWRMQGCHKRCQRPHCYILLLMSIFLPPEYRASAMQHRPGLPKQLWPSCDNQLATKIEQAIEVLAWGASKGASRNSWMHVVVLVKSKELQSLIVHDIIAHFNSSCFDEDWHMDKLTRLLGNTLSTRA